MTETQASSISSVFENRTFLVTGATGFLGQPLVEKILWSTPGIRRIYVLIRPKRSGGRVLTAQERLERQFFKSSVFDRLYTRHEAKTLTFLRDKVSAVGGDISEENLGLAEEDQELLRHEVDFIINAAAVVSFDAPLDKALELNVLSTARLVRFAVSCDKALLVHVSTAYVSGSDRRRVPETIHHTSPGGREKYPRGGFVDVDAEIRHLKSVIDGVFQEAHSEKVERELKSLLLQRFRGPSGGRKSRRREKIESLRQRWITRRLTEKGMAWARQRGWNDTYTYTKALGEQMVVRHRGQLPTVILRPSVIESSLNEPSPGWLDGLRMADPLIVAIGKGRLRALPMDANVILDLVPVDMVVNALLATIPVALKSGGLRVYQVATGMYNPITLGRLYALIHEYFLKNPMLDKQGRPIRIKPLHFPKPKAFRLRHRLRTVPLGTAEKTLSRLSRFPATQRIKRRVSAARVASEKLHYYGEIYEPYLNLDCRFEIQNTLELFHRLGRADRELFYFDVTQLNWRHYVQNVHIPGVKRHILKLEGMGTLEVEPPSLDPSLNPFTINGLVERGARLFPHKTALQIKRDGQWRRLTYWDILQSSRRVGARLHQLGLRQGDRVLLWSENQPEWGVAYLGASSRGLVIVPLDAQTWYKEVWRVARFTQARAILASESCFSRLKPEPADPKRSVTSSLLILNINRSCTPFPEGGAPPVETGESLPEAPPVEVAPDDDASIIFTTSTEVDPKGAVHSHRNFLNIILGVHHHLPIHSSDQLLSVLPLYHALEFTCGFLMSLYGGSTVTYTQSLKPKLILQTMRETGTTCMLGVPTLYALIRDDLERRVLRTSRSTLKSNWVATTKELSRSVERRLGKNIGRALFSRVHQEFGSQIRLFVSGGSALGEELYDDFLALGLPIYEGYGLTETAPVLTVNPLGRSRRGSAGKPLPGVELQIYRPDKEGVGEIIVRTPSLMRGYFANPEATQSVIRDGWFHTGDLGWVDADGYLYITGRIKDVIVTGAGKNVYPMDLEAIYRNVSSLSREVCVVGLKNGLTEDVHGVFVVDINIGDEGEEWARRKIRKDTVELSKELPSYHRLQHIHVQSEPLPRKPDGSLDRDAVRESVRARQGKTKRASGSAPTTPRALVIAEIARLSGVAPGEIHSGTDLYADLGLDSLMAIELLLFLEHEFQKSIPDEKAATLRTVGDVVKALGLSRPEVRRRPPKIHSALPYGKRPWGGRVSQAIFLHLLSLFYRRYLGLRWRGANFLPQSGAYLLAANHASHLDAPAVLCSLVSVGGIRSAQRLHILGARDYFFSQPLKSWFFSTFLTVVPVEREETSLAGLRMAKSILAEGEPVLIFPEGTRSRSGELQSFKPGLALIAVEAGVPIVPTHIRGTFQAMPAGRSWPRPGSIEVTFGPPLPSPPRAGRRRDALYREVTQDVRDAIARLGSGSDRPG